MKKRTKVTIEPRFLLTLFSFSSFLTFLCERYFTYSPCEEVLEKGRGAHKGGGGG